LLVRSLTVVSPVPRLGAIGNTIQAWPFGSRRRAGLTIY
jgi:hypothetical protein